MSTGGQKGVLQSRLHSSLRSGREFYQSAFSGENPGRGKLFKRGSGQCESLCLRPRCNSGVFEVLVSLISLAPLAIALISRRQTVQPNPTGKCYSPIKASLPGSTSSLVV